MNKKITIIVSIVAFCLIGGLIIGWSLYQKSGDDKKLALVKVFNDENFEADVVGASAKLPVLVDFYAEWCIPCRMLEPVIAELARDLEGKAVIGRLDTDKNLIPRKLGITKIPAVWIIRDGEIKSTFYGVVPKDDILKALKDLGA
jgi:thioredoxin 1